KEVLYDPATDMLVVISNDEKETVNLVPRLDDSGNQIKASGPKTNGKPWKEKQIQMRVPQEFYLTEREEALSFIKQFAINEDTFDYSRFFASMEEQMADKKVMAVESTPLLDEKGTPLKSTQKKTTTKKK